MAPLVYIICTQYLSDPLSAEFKQFFSKLGTVRTNDAQSEAYIKAAESASKDVQPEPGLLIVGAIEGTMYFLLGKIRGKGANDVSPDERHGLGDFSGDAVPDKVTGGGTFTMTLKEKSVDLRLNYDEERSTYTYSAEGQKWDIDGDWSGNWTDSF